MSKTKSLKQMNTEFNEYMCEPAGSFLWNVESVEPLAYHIHKELSGTIKQLQDRLSEAEKLTKQFVDHINDINNGDDPSECEKYLFNLVSEYQTKWKEKV